MTDNGPFEFASDSDRIAGICRQEYTVRQLVYLFTGGRNGKTQTLHLARSIATIRICRGPCAGTSKLEKAQHHDEERLGIG